jgi:hypothetical protein
VTDTKPEAKPSWSERIRAGLTELLDSLGMDDGSADAELEADTDAELEADTDAELEADTDADTDADASANAEGSAEEHADGEADAEGDDATPGGIEDGAAELADLRAKVIEQAATIETQRNMLAAAGIDADDEAEAEADIEDDTPEISEEDAIAAFDEDYAAQEAALAKIKEC